MNRVQASTATPEIDLPVDDQTKHLAYAQASMMLVECLMLTLIEQRIVTKEQLVMAVEGAVATKRQMVMDQESPEIATVAAGMLRTLANSLLAAEP